METSKCTAGCDVRHNKRYSQAPANGEQAVSRDEPLNFWVRYTPEQWLSENPSLPRLITRSSDIHAAGCFALEDIPKGTVVLEYTGERITKEEGDVRYEGRPFTYLFGIGDGAVVIDGHGMAMFVNHSCDPNCETDEIDGRIIIQTLRDLKAGEEITYDYWLYDGEDEAPCCCGSKNCRGSMYSPAEVKRMQRVAAKAKKEADPAERKNRAASNRERSKSAEPDGPAPTLV